MSESESSYKQIIKTTSLFGGVQFFNIIISIIRTKLIAVFIGPTGMGITTLLNSTINIIGGVSGLGIESSTVKYISEGFKNNDLSSVSRIISVVEKLAFITGIIGALLCLIFSKWLSILTFGNIDQMYSFVFLSITLLFKQLSNTQLGVLQGLRKMRFLAMSNLYANVTGLLFSIPLYYYYGIDAIVPIIIITSVFALLFSCFYSSKIKNKNSKTYKIQLSKDGRGIIKLGVMLTLSGFLTLLSTYIIQIYVGKYGTIQQLGFYNAGFTLLNSYVGIIFTVMSTDYFPRLTSICSENDKIRTSVTQQAFISIMIITPIVIIFLTLIPLIVEFLYTPKFSSIIPMVCFGIMGMLFKAVSWSMGYILIAKGDSNMFLKTAFGFNSISLILNILGYFFYGLEGLGFSFFVYYLIHFFVLKIITKKKYDFYFENKFYKNYLICISMCFIAFLLRYIPNLILKYSLMSSMIIISVVFVLYQLNNKVELKSLINSLIKKND